MCSLFVGPGPPEEETLRNPRGPRRTPITSTLKFRGCPTGPTPWAWQLGLNLGPCLGPRPPHGKQTRPLWAQSCRFCYKSRGRPPGGVLPVLILDRFAGSYRVTHIQVRPKNISSTRSDNNPRSLGQPGHSLLQRHYSSLLCTASGFFSGGSRRPLWFWPDPARFRGAGSSILADALRML